MCDPQSRSTLVDPCLAWLLPFSFEESFLFLLHCVATGRCRFWHPLLATPSVTLRPNGAPFRGKCRAELADRLVLFSCGSVAWLLALTCMSTVTVNEMCPLTLESATKSAGSPQLFVLRDC